jgi:hypothetical protein
MLHVSSEVLGISCGTSVPAAEDLSTIQQTLDDMARGAADWPDLRGCSASLKLAACSEK